MVQLPKYAALQSKYNHKYLRFVKENCIPPHTFLHFSEERIVTPYTKFEFEQAQCDPSLVHIKSCFNNRYWTSWPTDHHFIVAGATQKQEDRSKWTCTLFRPIFDSTNQAFRFCHIVLGYNVVLWRVGPPYGECLRAQWSVPDKDLCDLLIVINWDQSMISLPPYVAFANDGAYLTDVSRDCLSYLQFSAPNIESRGVGMEGYLTNDGKTRIRSRSLGKFWRRGQSNWIFADGDQTTSQNVDTLFSPIILGPTTVALRNLGNGKYGKSFTLGSKRHFLNADVSEIDVYARLEITELVRSRQIHNVIFHLSDATIHGETVTVLASASATNNNGVPSTVKLNLSYKDTRSSRWTSSITVKLPNVNTTIETRVPIIFDGKIGTSTIFSGEYRWGDIITTSNTNAITHEVTMPPMTTITGTLYATKGSCDIPFSYKQSDIRIGDFAEFEFADGVYYGTNYYNLKYELKINPLPDGKSNCSCPS